MYGLFLLSKFWTKDAEKGDVSCVLFLSVSGALLGLLLVKLASLFYLRVGTGDFVVVELFLFLQGIGE